MAKGKANKAKAAQKAARPKQIASTSSPNNNQWTVMVYMAADNTLVGESIWALTEINSVNFGSAMEVVALFDSAPPEVVTKRFVFSEKTQGVRPNQKPALLEDLGKKFNEIPPDETDKNKQGVTGTKAKPTSPEIVNTASDYRLLQHFLTTTIKAQRADKYLLVLSGHGSGAVGDFLTSDNPKGNLSITDLKKVLNAVKKDALKRKIDILGMDSCLMSMVEVCYEVRNSVELLVGAEGFEPETGWPYRQILGALNDNATMGTNQLAELIVNKHIEYYKNFATAGLSIDQSVCDLTQIDELADAIRELAETMTANLSTPAVQDALLLAHWRAQSYKSEQYVDLWDFCDLLQHNCPVKKIANTCIEVQKIVENVVQHSDYYGPAFQHSHGISVFFPWKDSGALQEYCKGLSFAKDTKWGDFLKEYVKQTVRKMRGDKRTTPDALLDKSLEEVKITAAVSPLMIPVQSDFPAGNRQPPGSDKQPPGSDKGLSKQGAMKNPPRYFLRNKKDKTAAH